MRCDNFLLKAHKLLMFWCIFGVALLIGGVITYIQASFTTCVTNTGYEYYEQFTYDYTDCYHFDQTYKCRDHMIAENTFYCQCAVDSISIEKEIVGDVVFLYRLDKFKNSNFTKEANYYQSRDDRQLSGILSNNPSEACRPYDYDENNRTIVPCGAIADAFFNDTYEIRYEDNQKEDFEIVPTLNTGLLTDSDKKGFHNPTTFDNLSIAFQNYSRPKSWSKDVWELDYENPENNGLQNEAFIAWMKTDWELKPVLRLDQSKPGYENGLPKGHYMLTINYNYHPTRYAGNRTFIIATRTIVSKQFSCPQGYAIGLAGIIIGLILLLIGFGLFLFVKYGSQSIDTDNNESKRESTNFAVSPKKPDRKSLLANPDVNEKELDPRHSASPKKPIRKSLLDRGDNENHNTEVQPNNKDRYTVKDVIEEIPNDNVKAAQKIETETPKNLRNGTVQIADREISEEVEKPVLKPIDTAEQALLRKNERNDQNNHEQKLLEEIKLKEIDSDDDYL